MEFNSSEGQRPKHAFEPPCLLHQGLSNGECEPIDSSNLPCKEEAIAAIAWRKLPNEEKVRETWILGGDMAMMWVNHPLKQEEIWEAEAIHERHRVPVTACSQVKGINNNSGYSHLFWSFSSIKVHVRRDLIIVIILKFKVNVSKPLMFS